MAIPTLLNIGSGKSFLPQALNVDVGARWQPDIVADLEQPFPAGPDAIYETVRFGPIRLRPGSFTHIVAFDVLEHLRDLTTCMTSCLQLLAPEGEFIIQVPYELSLGAWSDPTHVRAFNERSWVYYTAWAWYLGWTEAHFELADLRFDLSPAGQQLAQQGKPIEELLPIPRAVDSMRATLRKKVYTPEQQRQVREFLAGQGTRPVPVLTR